MHYCVHLFVCVLNLISFYINVIMCNNIGSSVPPPPIMDIPWGPQLRNRIDYALDIFQVKNKRVPNEIYLSFYIYNLWKYYF